ncbi:uncharacterized protein [Watersipora subatra]|uniref:uncharacterized protein n=1 Tax=Watersipora subatra TaxID=2589382 RepID=UPI00355C896B
MASCSSDCDSELSEQPLVKDWSRQPMVKADRRQQRFAVEKDRMEDVYVAPPVQQWCKCENCHAWSKKEMNICCTNHDMWHSIPQTGIKCVTEADEIKDLIKPGPLRVAYYNYCHYHVPKYPDAESLVPSERLKDCDIYNMVCRQRRLCAYRSLVFWTYPTGLRRGERRPLPACMYNMVQAAYPGTEDEDEYADMAHTEFEFTAVE